MSYEIIVKHCAPTLAGLKMGNLFSYQYESDHILNEQISHNNALLNKRGIYFLVLRRKNKIALVYVYRKDSLQKLLRTQKIQRFLDEYDYSEYSTASCLNLLEQHLVTEDFPHEIGIFLGYPLEDVKDFIKHKGSNYKHVGFWKVYNNLSDALITFERYRKCTNIYCKRFSEGYDISKLTVST